MPLYKVHAQYTIHQKLYLTPVLTSQYTIPYNSNGTCWMVAAREVGIGNYLTELYYKFYLQVQTSQYPKVILPNIMHHLPLAGCLFLFVEKIIAFVDKCASSNPYGHFPCLISNGWTEVFILFTISVLISPGAMDFH